MNSVIPALSFTGVVLGMQATAVNPPATADATPDATVSLCSCPGSRRWTCISISPGTITNPRGTSTTWTPSPTGRSRPTWAIRSPSINTSRSPSIPFTGSTTRPPLSSRFILGSTGQQVQHGHAHRDAVGDLLENDGERAVGDLGRDFDAAVHRTRMHDDDVRPRPAQARFGHTEHVEVLAQRGKKSALHALELNAQQ